MLRDLLSSRWFQAGLAFFLFCVGGSLLYSWHVQRTTETELERSNRFLRGTEQQKATRPPETVIVENTNDTPVFVNTPDETTDTPRADETEALPHETEFADLADAFLPDDMVSEEAPAEDVPVSPFGFGPYPEVPEAFIQQVGRPPWLVDRRSELPENTKRGIEIIYRVLIGLWKQGDESIISGFRYGSTGRVYPFYENTIYVRRHRPSKESQSKEIGIYSHPSVMLTAEELQILQDGGEAPAGIRVLDFDSAGVDPSPFLNMR